MAAHHRPLLTEKIAADQRIWFISDLHLGDATPCDVFFGKDRHLIALVERVEREGSLLVIVGDAVDFHQAWTFTRVLRAHQELFSAMTRLARDGRLFYVVGNHDFDISLFREILAFKVCDELRIGKHILVRHGYQYDPYTMDALTKGHGWSTTVHHLFERYLNTWLRIPLGEFYTKGNRLMFWLSHKIGLVAWAVNRITARFGAPAAQGVLDYLDYWARGNLGDPMGIFEPAWEHVKTGPYRYIVCGHSHLPGVVRTPEGDRAYLNTGSWTFSSSHYLVWDGDDWTCRDWITGRHFGEEFYAPLLNGSVQERNFWVWWRENYMGMFRFREGEERRGRLRGWESYVRDTQYLSQLPQMGPPRLDAISGPRLTSEEVPPATEDPVEDAVAVAPPDALR